jgi:ElaB/YqjD/DUF883 family membrane-anchored ribosome-binding protein
MLEKQSEVLVNEIDKKESELADKLETLEKKVVDVVQETTSAVEVARETVDHTIDAVHSAVDAVTNSLDLRKQVKQHPWPMMAIGFAAGFTLYHVALSVQSIADSRAHPENNESNADGSNVPKSTHLWPMLENAVARSFSASLQGLLTGLASELAHTLVRRPSAESGDGFAASG